MTKLRDDIPPQQVPALPTILMSPTHAERERWQQILVDAKIRAEQAEQRARAALEALRPFAELYADLVARKRVVPGSERSESLPLMPVWAWTGRVDTVAHVRDLARAAELVEKAR